MASICGICGDKVCGTGENKCNCPQDCSTVTATCAEVCKAQGYANGQCNTYAISPEGMKNKCPVGYVASNQSASDCQIRRDANGIPVIGVGAVCCCGNNLTSKCLQEGQSAFISNQQYSGCCEGLQQNWLNVAPTTPQYNCTNCGNGKCDYGETAATCSADCGGSTAQCIKEGMTFFEESEYSTTINQCCSGLVKIRYAECDPATSSSACFSDSQYICVKPANASKYIKKTYACSSNQDCVSDSGTCHQCFNKTFWNALSADKKEQYLCAGIGDALCKCQNGNCVVSSICGDGICDTAKGETAATCPKDCGGNNSSSAIGL